MEAIQINTCPLKPDLRRMKFEIQTHWNVLTGAACTGKTTLIRLLAAMGYKVIPESAREYFESQMAGGKSVEELRADGAGLQLGIARLQTAFEDSYKADELTFLDRALPDSLTFLRVNGEDPNTLLPHCFQRRYASVFLLERLPNQRSLQLGPEDDASSDFLNEWLEHDYNALGYQVIPVPVLPPRERVEFILDKVDRSLR